ncbi:hypothetical protein UCMB321_3965 [Pseudomonas batumici]|uniref:Uncharacterized protein n=1 Tax=Pseudomonas batumici TaxID=226910 RepID=A0A0C2E8U4_9PSED|nr:hypothetical protein UCMB321_3965 [Pseudomonas batumici]
MSFFSSQHQRSHGVAEQPLKNKTQPSRIRVMYYSHTPLFTAKIHLHEKAHTS